MSEIAKAVEWAMKDSQPVRDALVTTHLLAGAEKLEGAEAIEALEKFQAAYERTNIRPHVAAAILAERERELLELKGPCSNEKCGLHYAHSGTCGEKK